MSLTSYQLSDLARSDITKTALRAVVSVAAFLGLYAFLPIESRPHEEVGLRLIAGLALFVVVLGVELRAIAKHEHPMLRAVVAMATVLPMFLCVFAWSYLTMSRSNPATFGSALSRIDAMYFTVTVFSTVGFGDFTPKTELARVVVTVQMLADLAVIAVVIRMILGTATRVVGRRSTTDTVGSTGVPTDAEND